MRKIIAATLTVASVAPAFATTPNYAKLTPAQISKLVTVKRSKFNSETPVIGPQSVTKFPGSGFSDPGILTWLIRSWITKAGRASTSQIYLDLDYTDSHWRNYQSVNFVGGKMVKADLIDQQTGDCSEFSGCELDETIGISVPTTMLEQQGSNALQFRVNAQAGPNIVITIPGTYLEGFVQALRQAGAKIKAQPAATAPAAGTR